MLQRQFPEIRLVHLQFPVLRKFVFVDVLVGLAVFEFAWDCFMQEPRIHTRSHNNAQIRIPEPV